MKSIFAPHLVDFYKPPHADMFPDFLEELYGNFTPRGDKFAKVLPDFDHKIVWFGLQGVCQHLLIEIWNDTFFRKPKEEVVAKYKNRMDTSLGEGAVSIERMAALHDLGYLPIRIKSLPEGSRVNIRVAPYTCTSTHKDFAWVEQYLETQMSAELWGMITSATTAFEFRRLCNRYAVETGVDPAFVPFQGHDFSMRGMFSVWAAILSGAGHLLSFMGTDTVAAIDYVDDYYKSPKGTFIGGSVRATEHAVSSSNIIRIAASLEIDGEWNGWTKESLNPRSSDPYRSPNREWIDACPILEMAEVAFLKSLLIKYPKGILSYVSDTYDFWAVITRIAAHLKDDIMARDGKLVFRPDSGDPVKIVVGDANAGSIPERIGAIVCLWDIFGGTSTATGYQLLDSHVGMIYGDSISLERGEAIFSGLKSKMFASQPVFGIGSFTYQYVTRDTFGTAIKATHAAIAGVDYDLFKDPKTDDGLKKSARGFIRIEYENGNYVQYDQQTREQEAGGLLETVFLDGKMVRMQSLAEIRERLLGA